MSVLTFVTIGDPGNAADTTGYGDVGYTYDISKFAISEGNIAEYNADPINSTRQITLFSRGTDKPASDLSWNNAARYVNWLNILDGAQPAYRFTTVGVNDNIALWDVADSWTNGGENRFRHKDAKYFLPSEDEWYKAAYYKGGNINAGYWLYPTGSDTAPTAVASGVAPGTAVYNAPGGPGPADVTQAGGLSPYGTMGQGGNLSELIESAYDSNNDSPSELRVFRGGSYSSVDAPPHMLRSSNNNPVSPSGESQLVGLRVASVSVPPAAPTNLTATASSDTAIELSWDDASSDEDGFYVDRSLDSVTWDEEIANLPADSSSYSDSGLTSSTTYFYRVRSYNAQGEGVSDVTSAVTNATPTGNTSPVLNLADNLKMGPTQVTAAYLGSVRVWPEFDGIWRFDTPSPGTTITGFKVTTSSGGVFINWGDGETDFVNSGQSINKTY